MHQAVFFNNQIARAEDARIYALSSASLYGTGIFTTIAVYDGVPFLLDKHWSRLQRDSAKLGIDISNISEANVRDQLDQLLKINKVDYGKARITIFNDSPGSLWDFDAEANISLLIATSDLFKSPESIELTVSPFRINSASPIAGVKSCNYVEKITALQEAKNRGSDEAILMNERGSAASGCMANLFWLKDGKLFTPSLETGCLGGTTREYVIENFECSEVSEGLDRVMDAEAVFLTSAGLGVVRACSIDGKQLETPDHPILSLLPKTRKNTKPREN